MFTYDELSLLYDLVEEHLKNRSICLADKDCWGSETEYQAAYTLASKYDKLLQHLDRERAKMS